MLKLPFLFDNDKNEIYPILVQVKKNLDFKLQVAHYYKYLLFDFFRQNKALSENLNGEFK